MMSQFQNQFATLTEREKWDIVTNFLYNCSGSTLISIKEIVDERLLFVDFFGLFPFELSDFIVDLLDLKDLKNVCLVNKTWRNVVIRKNPLWKTACQHLKINFDLSLFPDDYWKNCVKLTIKRYDSFDWFHFYKAYNPHCNHTTPAHISVVQNEEELWAIGFDNQVIVRSSGTGTLAFSCSNKISSIKLTRSNVFCGSFVGTIKRFRHFGMVFGEYNGHASAVTCLHCDEYDKLLISGGWDGVGKVWNIETTQLLHVIPSCLHPIKETSIKLIPNCGRSGFVVLASVLSSNDTKSLSCGFFRLSVWKLNFSNDHECISAELSTLDEKPKTCAGVQFQRNSLIRLIFNELTKQYTLNAMVINSDGTLQEGISHKIDGRVCGIVNLKLLNMGERFMVLLNEHQTLIVLIKFGNSEWRKFRVFPMKVSISNPKNDVQLFNNLWLDGFTENDKNLAFLLFNNYQSEVSIYHWNKVNE